MVLPMKTLLALLPFFLHANAQASGTGTTTRYWDCCKTSCAWSGKATLADGSNPVTTCDINDNPLTDYDTASGCDGGDAYMCSDQSPWAVSDTLAYGFAAVSIAGGSESSWCCACYELTFTSGAAEGKKMIVQATNTGSDLGSNQFDLAIPGGGVGIYNGCTDEWGAPSSGWGQQYGGISAVDSCSSFPSALQPGCDWRFDWFEGSDNPTVSFEQVTCPAAITAKSGCVRADDSISESPTGASVVSTYGASATAAGSSSTAASSAVSSSSAAAVSSVVSSSSSVLPVATVSDLTYSTSSSSAFSFAAAPTVSSTITVTVVPTPAESSTAAAPTSSAEDLSDDDTCEF